MMQKSLNLKMHDPLSAARRLVNTASEKQAEDILLLDVQGLASFVDYLVILTAANIRQLSSIADELMLDMKKDGLALHHREGTYDSGWVLLDFNDVIVHIFSARERNFYQLEKVWDEGKQIVRIQ